MPLGFARLNEQKSRPNDHINFIKPLKGNDEEISQKYLDRIAAQCLPVMREHHLYVMSLEEFPPNREFAGRNFNNGEVIQLVLKSLHTGRWLPFEYVQMVMMHELAHCKQMNHSKAFWTLRNQYADQMRQLWSQGYTGDGLWGRGAQLGTGEWESGSVNPDDAFPEQLCGGTYRSRRRKRKTKPTLSYQEQKERRILKKFGPNGVALGADEEVKVKLEKGKKTQAKPRVAGSQRGRELRAAAALARFEQQKTEKQEVKQEVKDENDEETESEYEEDTKDAVDVDGRRLVDGNGHGMVRVCEGEGEEGDEIRNEMRELEASIQSRLSSGIKREDTSRDRLEPARIKMEEGMSLRDIPAKQRTNDSPIGEANNAADTANTTGQSKRTIENTPVQESDQKKPTPTSRPAATAHQPERTTQRLDLRGAASSLPASCPICAFSNPYTAITCAMCSHVLDMASVPNSWSCAASACNPEYVNSGDCGVCGICGTKRRDGI